MSFSVDPMVATSPVIGWLEPLLRHAVWFGFFLFLAPAVGPRGYGSFALGFAGIAMLETAIGDSVAAALLGLPALHRAHLSSALTSALAIGGALTLALAGFARSAGAMLDDAAFADIFGSLTMLPLLAGVAAVPAAQLRRAGRAVPPLAAEAAGAVAGGAAGLALAWAGAGAWSLAAQIVVQRFVACAGLWLAASQPVGLGWSRRHCGELLAALDWRCVPLDMVRDVPCLAAGLALGPTAAGLCLLALRLAAAVSELARAAAPRSPQSSPAAAAATGAAAMLAAMVAAALLPVTLPPLLDPPWWGAILPAQALLLAAAVPLALDVVQQRLDRRP
ncbi:MAG: oligosaccharide flippase family protein, partial [Alphaproteobacteria bacterium]|nr:oligosaccharide flippase family protein [Alphaproteobacteria bacterium]